MLPDLRIHFVDTFIGCADKFFINLLSKRFNVIVDPVNFDYLIFGDINFGQENLKYKNNCTRIFYTGENVQLSNYDAHYYIGFDHLIASNYYRLPLYEVERYHLETEYNIDNYTFETKLSSRRKFCSFIASNNNAKERNNLVKKLQEKQFVSCGGPVMNNVPIVPRDTRKKLEFLNEHDFTICYENSSAPGYVTEKILHAFLAKTIPIYWGSTTLDLDFPTNSIIYRPLYNSDEEMIDHILNIWDTDEYDYMISNNEYILNCHNLKKCYGHTDDKFLNWFSNVVYKGSK